MEEEEKEVGVIEITKYQSEIDGKIFDDEDVAERYDTDLAESLLKSSLSETYYKSIREMYSNSKNNDEILKYLATDGGGSRKVRSLTGPEILDYLFNNYRLELTSLLKELNSINTDFEAASKVYNSKFKRDVEEEEKDSKEEDEK